MCTHVIHRATASGPSQHMHGLFCCPGVPCLFPLTPSHCLNCSFTVGYFSLVPVGTYREGRMFFPTSDTEVENRCAPRLDSWYLSSGVKLKLCSHSDSPRTKSVAEAELCWSKEIRWPLLRSRKTSLPAYAQETPWVSKMERTPPRNKCTPIIIIFPQPSAVESY